MIVGFWWLGIALISLELTTAWDISPLEAGIAGSLVSAGMLLGSVLFGGISDLYGRIFAYKICAVVYIVFTIIMMCSVNMIMIYIAAFAVGAGYGGDVTNTASILTDSLPLSKRWVLTFLTIFWAVGATIIIILGLILNALSVESILIFRFLMGFILVCCIMALIMRMFMDETAKQLFSVGKHDEAV